MSSSDGEEFESADESFDEESADNVKKKKNVTLKNEKNDENSSKKETKVVDSKQEDEKTAAKVEENWEFEDWGNDNQVEVTTQPKKEDKQEIPKQLKEDVPKPALKEMRKEVKRDLPKPDPVETTQTSSSQGGDGWDVFDDNWEDVDKPDATSNKPLTTKPDRNDSKYSRQATEEKEISGVFDKLTKDSENASKSSSSWSGWKPWGGVVSLLSTASESVASLTTNVSKGISNVIESGIGVPDPEELARTQREEHKKMKDQRTDSPDNDDKLLDLGSIVSNVTQISNRVISGGLDTLEGIGKKTMNILQENDPGLINKRKMLGLDNDRPVLSQMLREAKEKSEETERNLKLVQKSMYRKQIHFETLFDDYHGLVHLEALEMLSKQSSINLQSLLVPLSGKALQDLQETLNEVVELCELPDDNDDCDGMHASNELAEKLAAAVEDLDVPVDFTDIIKCWDEHTAWLSSTDEEITSQDIHDKALRCLAKTTALAVHQMHKLAEKLLVLEHHSTANEADSLVQLTAVLCWHLSGVATRFSGQVGKTGLNDELNNLITSIFLEGSNSTSYIQKTFQLFIPILQVGAA